MEMKADLTEELAIVKALIAKNGQPKLTEEALRDAASKGAARSVEIDVTSGMFKVGDKVAVLRAARLPQVEEVLGYGVVEAMTKGAAPCYFVSGFPCGRGADVLRIVEQS